MGLHGSISEATQTRVRCIFQKLSQQRLASPQPAGVPAEHALLCKARLALSETDITRRCSSAADPISWPRRGETLPASLAVPDDPARKVLSHD